MSGVVMVVEQCARALGHAVVQSLWQCALVGALAAAVQIGVRRAAARYAVWCAALALCAGWFAVTFVDGLGHVFGHGRGAGSGAAIGVLGGGGLASGVRAEAAGSGGLGLFEAIAVLWALGFVFVGARFVRQWGSARRLRTRGVTEASGSWAALYAEVRGSLGVAARVRLLVSDVARSPMVVGWLTPTVVVPASVFTMMGPEQVRLVLAHELAHIRRYDHVVNMLQVLVETVMFYHPVVWWVSQRARVEREHCCDDAAVRWGGDAVSYARALTDLEEVRVRSRAVLAMSSRFHGGSLMNRIQRLFDGSDARRGSGSMRALAALTAGTLIAGAAYAHSAWNAETPREETVAAVRAGVASGVMTRDQARRVFREVIFPGSELERSFEKELEYYRRELEAEGASAQGARKMLGVIEGGFDDRIERAFRMQVLGMSGREADLSMFADDLDRAVAQGGMTREVADALYQSQVDAMDRPVVPAEARALRDYKAAIEVTRQVLLALEAQIAEVDASVEKGEMDPDAADSLRVELRRRYTETRLKQDEAERALRELIASREAEGGASQEVELVPIIKDAHVILKGRLRPVEARDEGLILPGVGEGAMRLRRDTEKGSLSYYERHVREGFLESVRREQLAGVLSDAEAKRRIEVEARRQRFEARWLSIDVMYQEEVSAGRMSVAEANGHLRRAMKENGYYESEFARPEGQNGMLIVEADHVFDIWVTPEGEPTDPPVELKLEPVQEEKKLTPMDEEYWYHQGIRPLEAYDESFLDDC